MRVLFRLFVVLLFLAFAACAAVAVSFWMESDGLVTRAAQSGAFRQAPNSQHLTLVEHTIALDQFSQTWGRRAVPCRTADLLWTDLTDSNATIPAMPVSQRVATSMFSRQRSIRGQLQRIVVSCQLEQRFEDTHLLRTWLATAYFGEATRGIEAAAQSNFGKPASALNAEESAKLAALLRTPGLRAQPDQWARRAQAISERIAAQPH